MWAHSDSVSFRCYMLAVLVAAVLPCHAADAEELSKLMAAAEAGSAAGQAKLGYLYYVGKGVQRDPAQAARWFGAAARQGNADACYNLGAMYYTGQDLGQDRGEAMKWFRCAAEQGHLQGSYFLGSSLALAGAESGDAAVATEGIRWLQQAARAGHVRAQVKLADLSSTGTATPVDHETAAYWYDKAARNGDATAQYNLGLMHYAGRGVPANTDFAVYWLQQASARGLQQATESLRDIRAGASQVAVAGQARQGHATPHAGDASALGQAPGAGTDGATGELGDNEGSGSSVQAEQEPARVVSPPLATAVGQAPGAEPGETAATGTNADDIETAATMPASAEPQAAPQRVITPPLAAAPVETPEPASDDATVAEEGASGAAEPEAAATEAPDEPQRVVSPPLATAQDEQVGHDATLAMTEPDLGTEPTAGDGNDYEPLALPYDQPIAVIEEMALLGEPRAQLLLAAYHHTGNKAIQSWELAFVWLKKAAQNGMPMAQRLLGHCYHAGIGTAVDHDESMFWYQIAAAGGNRQAAAVLSRHANLNPDLVHENLYLHMNALAHDKTELLAVAPPVGNHVHSPSTQSMASADLLRARYDFEIGLSYNMAHSPDHNLEVAFSWFLRAAQLGYAPAQHRVGIALAHGRGAEADPQRARTWLRRAANQGHLLAQRSLAALAEQRQDLVTAYAWRSIAALGSEHEDLNGLEQLARRMSPNQIDAARITAEGMLPSPGQDARQPGHGDDGQP